MRKSFLVAVLLAVLVTVSTGALRPVPLHVDLPGATTTTAATMEDITGLIVNVVLRKSGYIYASMALSVESTGGGTNALCVTAISIAGEDSEGVSRFLDGTNDRGVVAVVESNDTILAAGTHVVKGRWHRGAGNKTIQTQAGELVAIPFEM